MGSLCEDDRPQPAARAAAAESGRSDDGLHRSEPSKPTRSFGIGFVAMLAPIGIVIGLLLGAPTPASADCVPDSATATTGDDVVCTGTTPGGFVAGPGVEDLSVTVDAAATVNNAAAGDAAIEVGSNNPRGVDVQGLLELTGDGSGGVRGGDANLVTLTGTITDTNGNGQTPGGDDVVAIDLGDGATVHHDGSIRLNGDRNVGVRVGNGSTVDSTVVGSPAVGRILIVGDDATGIQAGDDSRVTISNGTAAIDLTGDRATGIVVGDIDTASGSTPYLEFDGDLDITGDDARGLVIGNAGDPAIAGPGIEVGGSVTVDGANARGIVAGDGWNDVGGGVRIAPGANVSATGDSAIAIDVGDDTSVHVGGVVTGGSPAGSGAIGIRTGDFTGPDPGVVVTGVVHAEGPDSIGISTGSRTLPIGESLLGAPVATIEIGALFDPGQVDGRPGSGALIELRTGTDDDDYSYVSIGQGSSVLADESRFFEPNRAIAILGTDGAERVDNYGQIRGKVLLEGGDDLFVLGRGGAIVGSQNVDGGDGRDRLELSNRENVFTGPGDAVFSFSRFWNFESLVVDDPRPWRATGSPGANDFESAFITAGSSLTLEGGPLRFTSGDDTFVNEGFFDGAAQLGDGADLYQQLRPDGLAASGRIDAGAGLDTLDLGSDGSGALGVLDLDAQVIGFESILLRTGSRWQLGGDATASASGVSVDVQGDAALGVARPLVVDGPVDFADASTLEVALSQRFGRAFVETSGAITIENGPLDSTLVVQPTGAYRDGSVLVLEGGSLTGAFDVFIQGSTSAYAFTPRYDYASGSLFVDVIVLSSLPPNRQATNDYLLDVQDSGGDADLQLFLDELQMLPSDVYKATLDQLHPEPYDAQTSLQLALAREFQQAMLDRPDHCIAPEGSGRRHRLTRVPCRPRPVDVWATGYGLFRSREGEVGHVGWDDSGGGVVLGIDRRLEHDVLVSGTLGGASASQTVTGIGDGHFGALDVGALVAWSPGPLRAQLFGTYGHGWHEADRGIAFGSVALMANGKYQSNRYALGGELAWVFPLEGLDVAPVFELDWARVARPGFSETGASPANLLVRGAEDSVTTLAVGVEVGTSWLRTGYWTDFLEKADGVWEPQLSVKWRQVVQGSERGLVSSYEGAPAAAGRFTVAGNDADQGFDLGVGLFFTPKGANRVTFGVRYDAFVWKDVLAQDVTGTVRFSF